MKTIFAMLALCLSFNLFMIPNLAHASDAKNWADLQAGDSLTLKSDLRVTDQLTLKAGSTFSLDSLDSLDPVPVMTYSLSLTPCTPDVDVGPIEMTMIQNNSYGFEYGNSCKVTLYVEFKDLEIASLFE